MQKACRAAWPGASSQAIDGWMVATARLISSMSAGSNLPDEIAWATRSRPPGHHVQKSAGARLPEARLKNDIVGLPLELGDRLEPRGEMPERRRFRLDHPKAMQVGGP